MNVFVSAGKIAPKGYFGGKEKSARPLTEKDLIRSVSVSIDRDYIWGGFSALFFWISGSSKSRLEGMVGSRISVPTLSGGAI
jgi:hypothetical protein